MPPYDTPPHHRGIQALRKGDESRFATVSLTVTRNRNGRGTVSVTVRDVRNGMLRDTRLGIAEIPLTPGSLPASDPLACLTDALDAVTGRIHP